MNRLNWLGTAKLTQNVSGAMRSISTSFGYRKQSHYQALGLSPEATQNDIKSAYYKLSMMYHPDKNKGSEVAAVKFREITAAYEVLGNYRTRKLYDKGILYDGTTTIERTYTDPTEPQPEDDAQTKFYKARMHRTEAPHASGRTPIYDFDDWSKEQYGVNFERRKKAQSKHDAKKARLENDQFMIQKEKILLFLAVVLMVCLANFRTSETPKSGGGDDSSKSR